MARIEDAHVQDAGRIGPRRALVTGAGSGIGRAIVRRLAADATLLVLVGRRRGALEESARICSDVNPGVECLVMDADVSSVADVERVAGELAAQSDALDALVNNAGRAFFGRVEETTPEEWASVLGINLGGPFLVTRALLPLLRRGDGPAVVNVASTVGVVGLKGAAAYCASKAGLINLTRVLALDHASEGIRFNAVAPGVVDTEMMQVARKGSGLRSALRTELEDMHPLGRVATPGEIAETVCFLLSPRSSFTTGALVAVDGGLLSGFQQ